jgi:hypothetical protein
LISWYNHCQLFNVLYFQIKSMSVFKQGVCESLIIKV